MGNYFLDKRYCEKLYLLFYMFISDTCIEFHCFNILQSIMSHISCTVRTCKSSKIKNPELTFFTIPDILSQKCYGSGRLQRLASKLVRVLALRRLLREAV